MKKRMIALYVGVIIAVTSVCVVVFSGVSLAGAPVTLKVMRPGYPKEARAFFTEVQKGMAKEYPDIRLEIVDADWNTFHSRAPIWVTGKQEPDVYLCSQTDLAGFVDIGAVIPLDTFIDAKLKADIPAGAWDSVRYKGHILAIPGDYAPFVLWYNKDVFKKAGLDPQKPPTTWDELLQAALKIKQNSDVAPIGVGVGRALDFTQLVWGMLFYSATNEQYVDDAGRPKLMGENSIKAHQFLVDLVRKHKVTIPDPQLYSKGDMRLLFRDEKVAMVVDGPWLMNVVASKTNLSTAETSKFGIAPAPRSSVKGKLPMYASTADAWVISANSKHPEEAKKVLQFLLRPEWQYAHDRFVQQMPYRKSLFSEPAKYPLANNWVYRGMSEMMDNTVPFQPIIPTANAVFQAMQNAVVKMVTGAASVEDATKEASEAIRAANANK
jgi:multiple sugar transport system substrate-binding protein